MFFVNTEMCKVFFKLLRTSLCILNYMKALL